MKKMRLLATAALIAAAPFVTTTAMAQNHSNNSKAADTGPTLTLDAEATTRVPEDTAWAQFSVEKESKDQAQAQQLGKTALADVLATVKKSPSLQVTTENLFTTPVYNKDGKISSWRTNFNVQIESTDTAQVGQTMAALMDKARLAGSGFRLSDAARRKAQDQLIADAVKAFEAKAKVTASAMGFARYEYGNINLNQSGTSQPMMRANRGYAMSKSADASEPVGLEAGYTTVSVTLSGSVKLIK
ncbi:SIMPL domain-containing protein [Comamonas odontotermitis]|uniref:SIMPL domain-containing protein n=1 Tax=Comamonas odontotermitis TaxID=379895 RepID=UPI001CC422CD|nr:SIMPL domain-containing protein [Comamonas odontotermitis]UBB18222.1 SIMPL domain-containing protein [Comamonas odontotermitis]